MAEQSIEELKAKIALYETNGAAKLFYSLNRKMNELADMLNRQSLATLDIADAKDKSFERLKIAWNEAAGIATAVKALEATAGITNDEARDTQIPIFRVTPESMADSIGELAGKKS
tara:strand:- start:2819 stop:3166 length:348 start_codon:yes stop_codon:yes gene_type:complete